MSKWQTRIEKKYGFDPIEYFGGTVDEEVDSLDKVHKDPRFSGNISLLIYFL